MINSHTKFGWISFNSKGEDNISDCDDARKYLEIFLFFEKSYLQNSLPPLISTRTPDGIFC